MSARPAMRAECFAATYVVLRPRAPVRFAEAAHVHADHLAPGAELLRDRQPVPGEVLQAVHDQDRDFAPRSEPAVVDREIA
jgi:hypothetical protein